MSTETLSFFDGKPTIRGQRITVQTILEFLRAGESSEEILKQYPTLTQADVLKEQTYL